MLTFAAGAAGEAYSSVGWAFRPRSAITLEELGIATLGTHMIAVNGRFALGPGVTPNSPVTSAVSSVEIGVFERSSNRLVASTVINPAVATRQVAITNTLGFYQGSTIWYREIPSVRLLPSTDYMILFARESGLPGATTGMQGFWKLALSGVVTDERLEMQVERIVANDSPFLRNDGVRYDPNQIFFFDQPNEAVDVTFGPTFTFSRGGGPMQVVPEPGTLLLTGSGFAMLVGATRVRRARAE